MAGVLEIAQKAGVKVEDATKVFRAFSDMIADGEEKIIIQGLGNIDYSYRGEKTSRNPATGEQVEVAAKVVPKFNFNRNLKEKVDANKKIRKAAKAKYDELAAKREARADKAGSKDKGTEKTSKKGKK